MGEDKISGKDIADFLGVSQDYYKDFEPSVSGHTYFSPDELLNYDKVISNFIEGLNPVTEGIYRTGEIWLDIPYQTMYLYFGQNEKGQDVAFEVGGDTHDAGKMNYGMINSNDSEKLCLNFHKRIFPC